MHEYRDQVLQEAEAIVALVDMKYNEADFATKIGLKPERDKVFENYTRARRNLLEGKVQVDEKDLQDMRSIRADITKAAQGQEIILATAKFAVFLGKLAA